ncbi:MAG: hypothetical protein N3A69_18160 [Leptospiraceae bacterium]|nr:hypothetical protein [Leptospiraceae bacterium]
MFEWLKNLFEGNNKKKIQEIANRVERFMQRYAQTKDIIKHNIAKKYHVLILNSSTVEEAKHYEDEFYKKIEEQGSDLKNYKQSKEYADNSNIDVVYENSSSQNYSDDAAIYYSIQNSQITNDNQTSEGEGEFGGGGASASWEETGSDNS